MRISRRNLCIGLGVGALATIGLAVPPVRRLFHPLVVRVRGARTIEDRVGEFARAGERVREQCRRAGVSFPPARVVLLGLKDEARLEVYAGERDDALRRIAEYPILAASGAIGPKLREGDRQVPEGVYALDSLNPNSRFHVALRVGYPNALDRETAERDGRAQLGGDIMIHGGAASVGCLAMGDPAAEDLFILAAASCIENVMIMLSPLDLRRRLLPPELAGGSHAERYAAIKSEVARLPA